MAGSEGVDPAGSVLLEYSLLASLDELPGLVEQVESCILLAELPLETGLQFTIAFDEVISNLASHATAAAGRDVHVDVILVLYPGRLEATVWDDGPPFDMTSVQDPDTDASLDERSIGGLGLFIVRSVMDEVLHDHLDGKNRLFLSKRIQLP